LNINKMMKRRTAEIKNVYVVGKREYISRSLKCTFMHAHANLFTEGSY